MGVPAGIPNSGKELSKWSNFSVILSSGRGLINPAIGRAKPAHQLRMQLLEAGMRLPKVEVYSYLYSYFSLSLYDF